MTRGSVEPLRIVDDAKQGALLGHRREQTEYGQGHEERVRRGAEGDAQRDAQRVALRLWDGDGVGAREQWRAELMQAGERKLHLRLNPCDLRDVKVGRLPNRMPQQRGLADARLTANNEHSALPTARTRQQLFEQFTLAGPAQEPGVRG